MTGLIIGKLLHVIQLIAIDPIEAATLVVIISGLMQVVKGLLVGRIREEWFPIICIGIGILVQFVNVCGLQGLTHYNGVYALMSGGFYGGLATGLFSGLKPVYNKATADASPPEEGG